MPYGTAAERDSAIASALASVTLSNGQSWTGGPTFNLLRGSNVLRNLSVAGALTASFQNLDDTILIESDSYARSQTFTQAETGAAITAAIDALDLSQFQNEAQVLALIATALVPYWNQTEVSTYVAGELSNYATSSSVTSAISSALSSYDDSSQVDSKIITALLDFYTRTEVDQQITNALGNVDLSNYLTQAETQTYVASELLAYYPRTELDSQLTATFTQYWTSGRTQTEIDDAIAGAGFLTQAQADTRYFAVSANASFESPNVTPPMIKALLPRAPLAANTILTETTLELTCDAWTKAESDGRYLSSSSFAPLDARYFVRNPAVAEGNGLFHLVQDQFTPQFIRSLLFRPPLTGGAILGNGSVIEIEADCWSKAQSDGRYPLVATFNSLETTVTSIDGRVTALENAPGVAPTADLTVNSLTATSFIQTPLLQSAAADLQIRNATTTLRAEDGLEDVETKPAATFRVLRDNAEKFEHNKNLTEGRQRRLEEAGAFRAPTNAARSFQPQYGPVREVAGYDSTTVRATDGSGDSAEAGAARAEGLGRVEGTAHEAARAAGRPAAAGLQPGTRGTALTRSVEKLQNQNPSKNCRAPEPA